jgi:DNA-binding transcriptional MerR regulator/methylmalonyl-CoA mutase cobalamin-binding subunit
MAETLPGALLGIAAVERDTGISKDSLRVWERRYRFPLPERDAAGERAYSPEQVHKLRLIKRLLDLGHRAGRLVPAPLEQLQALLGEAQRQQAVQAGEPAAALQPYLDALKAHDVDRLRRMLAQALLRDGLGQGVVGLIAPLTTQVGELWMRGELQVFEEHIYSESLQLVLRQAILAVPPQLRAARPRVLLTTLPAEQHGLGLLMAEALLALEGCHCLSLGVQTPPADVVLAAAAHRADIVALSFGGYLGPAQVNEALADLRARLPAAVELWAGGSNAVLSRRGMPPEVLLVGELSDIATQVSRWRAAQPA